MGSLRLINHLLPFVNQGELMGNLCLLLCLMPEDFTRQREKRFGFLGLAFILLMIHKLYELQ